MRQKRVLIKSGSLTSCQVKDAGTRLPDKMSVLNLTYWIMLFRAGNISFRSVICTQQVSEMQCSCSQVRLATKGLQTAISTFQMFVACIHLAVNDIMRLADHLNHQKRLDTVILLQVSKPGSHELREVSYWDRQKHCFLFICCFFEAGECRGMMCGTMPNVL
jgi:hypothetical protein